ncbi:rhomboid family intramembrane serine protease [Leucothrix sargassi]|nr:rhomboid family intramembrane serine protease [Leucothrix sargassi]
MNTMITPAVKVLIIINVVIFLVNGATLYDLNDLLGLYIPENENFAIWQLVTSMFMHGGVMHIIFNMMGLWMFGSALERIWGSKKFLFLYFAAGIGAGVISNLVSSYEYAGLVSALNALGMHSSDIKYVLETRYYTPLNGITPEMIGELYQSYHTVTVGASGALYGVIVACAMRFPNAKMMLMFIPFPIAAKYFVPVLLSIDLFSGITGYSLFGGGIAHFAHLGGALIGFLLMLYWRNIR